MLDLVLTFLPLLLLAAAVLSGRYVGEERLLRAERRAWPGRARTARPRRPRSARGRSLLERAPMSGRGPPRSVLTPH